jgi:hypothetical protein
MPGNVLFACRDACGLQGLIVQAAKVGRVDWRIYFFGKLLPCPKGVGKRHNTHRTTPAFHVVLSLSGTAAFKQ